MNVIHRLACGAKGIYTVIVNKTVNSNSFHDESASSATGIWYAASKILIVWTC